MEPKRPDVYIGFQRPFQPRVQREFQLAFGDTALSLEFSWACCDKQGRGLVSLTQILAHFKRHEGEPAAALAAVEQQLTRVERVEPPVPPKPDEPTDWVVEWLKEHELGAYAQNLLDQKIATKEDLLIRPWSDQVIVHRLW